MRAVSRNTLIILIFYALCAGGLLLWVERELNGALAELGESTAELVAEQIGAVLHQNVSDSLDGKSRSELRELKDAVTVATEKSAVLSDIEIIDASGKVIVSDDENVDKKLREKPEDLFAKSQDAIIQKLEDSDKLRRFEIKVPIKLKDAYRAYIQLVMEYKPISELYDQVYTYFLVAALAGLFIIIGIGLLIETQFSSFANMLAQILEDATHRGETEKSDGSTRELSGVAAAAKQLGSKLRHARTEADLKKYELEKLTKILQVGVVLQDENNDVDFISETAKHLVSGADDERFSEDYSSIQEEIDSAIESMKSDGLIVAQVDVTLDSHEIERRLRCEIHPVDSHGWKGHLVLIKDSVMLDALNEDLRAATRARNLARLYVGAAHDLKAPLNNMMMSLRVLKDGLTIDSDKQHSLGSAQELDNLEREVNRLTRLLSILLEQAAPQSAEREQIELADVIRNLSSLVSAQAKIQNVEVEIHIVDESVVIKGFINQIQQAVLNIIINGLDAMQKGGNLSITVSKSAMNARVSVCDSGAGIPTSLLPNIFDMHFTTRDSGTGIGLYVSKVVAEQHGGDIKVKSTLGEGSCFDITLPLA